MTLSEAYAEPEKFLLFSRTADAFAINSDVEKKFIFNSVEQLRIRPPAQFLSYPILQPGLHSQLILAVCDHKSLSAGHRTRPCLNHTQCESPNQPNHATPYHFRLDIPAPRSGLFFPVIPFAGRFRFHYLSAR